MAVNRKGDDDVLDIEDLDSGSLDEIVEGEGRKGDAATGTPGGERGEGDDHRSDDDVHALLKAERKAKKRLEQRLGRTNRDLLALREETRRQGEQLSALTKRELDRLAGSKAEAVTAATAKLRKAIDDGDPDAHIAAQRELTRAEREEAGVKDAIERSRASPRRSQDEDEGPSEAVQENVADWMAENPWFKVDGRDELSTTARALSQAIEDQGLSAEDTKHFRELDRQMDKLFPDRNGKKGKRPVQDDDDDAELDVAATPGSSRRSSGQEEAARAERDPSPQQIKAYEVMTEHKWSTKEGREHIRKAHARYSQEKGVRTRG